MLLLRPAISSDKEEIPDLNLPASLEEAAIPKHSAAKAQNKASVEIFTNKFHNDKGVPVEMRPVPEYLVGTGLFQSKKSVSISGKRYYSDEQRKEWQILKKQQRSLQSGDVRKAIHRKEYHRKRKKIEAMEPQLRAEHNARQQIKNQENLSIICSLAYATKEPIPDLNIPLSMEDYTEKDVGTQKGKRKRKTSIQAIDKPLHTMTNRKHKNIKVMSSQKNQVLINGNLFYSDLQRKKWRESKQVARERLKQVLPTKELRKLWKAKQRKYRGKLSKEKREEINKKRRVQRGGKKISTLYFLLYRLLAAMISILIWWLALDFICPFLAMKHNIPDLNHSPPSSPETNEVSAKEHFQDAEKTRLESRFRSHHSLHGIGSGESSTFRERRHDGQTTSHHFDSVDQSSIAGFAGALPSFSLQSDKSANVPQGVEKRTTDDEHQRIKTEKIKAKWRRVQKRRRKNMTKEQKKQESDKNYERYKDRMCKIKDDRGDCLHILQPFPIHKSDEEYEKERERKNRNQRNYLKRLKVKNTNTKSRKNTS
ncbi:uncharacterized protein FA14DRAFT_154390 [Meira miltonrushii]|uniref:Uncharacterized protein n=1 Tax=Meira miltonrushii TaxID=1280837 RepID=A0A316VBP6_9BASI|nr:uncharacterized protein FA14DRAFT_154390 [Meira miltonrushii]PWN34956.1 hypothetical protein FA14DRAFT_154390 [Meira miltonrushii]